MFSSGSRSRGYGRSGRGGQRGGRGRGDGRRGDYFARGGMNERNGGPRSGPQICRYTEQGQQCRRGDTCPYSHDLSSRHDRPREQRQDTPEQRQEREDYNTWKRLIKREPIHNDIYTIERIWTGALSILEDGDREWKQMLVRDLDNEENYGRQHIRTIMGMESHSGGSGTFIKLSQSFLSVITHPAILDCLSVDTFVGNLYNFISGSNGTRVVSFLQRLFKSIAEAHRTSSLAASTAEALLCSTTATLLEVLKREHRASFHEELVDLIDGIQNTTGLTVLNKDSSALPIINNRCDELRTITARAMGLLQESKPAQVNGISTSALKSTYPKQTITPSGHHNNDYPDIPKISILPTEDEISCDHPEFLPTTDPDEPYFLDDPVQRHLDTHFRLLRHDIFGEMKEALAGLIRGVNDNPTMLNNRKLNIGDIRAYPYPKAHVGYVSFDQRRGIEAHISFPQLPSLQKKSAAEKRKWWDESKRLEDGSLLTFVVFINNKCSLLFLTVSQRNTDPKADYNLTSNQHMCTIVTKLATRSQADVELLTRLHCQKTSGALIEFPGVLLATFIPILENLQQMQRLSRLPFHQWILPERPSFDFPLDSILKKGGTRLALTPQASPDDLHIIEQVEAQTTLDRGQCQALIAALTREFAFIQGPPGTGKSYLGVHLMRVLLACKDQANLGPIVVVCYTNHALDQFLEHLIQVGIEKIIRIGGQSKSEILEGKNLRLVSRGEGKTKSESYLVAKTHEDLGTKESRIKAVLGRLHTTQNKPSWENLNFHLRRRYREIYDQFSRVDKAEFKVVGRHPFDIWLQGMRNDGDKNKCHKSEDAQGSTTDKNILLRNAKRDVHSLSAQARHNLVAIWVREIYEHSTDELFELVKESHHLQEQIAKIHDEVDRRVLSTADVIGVTTTGLAKRISVLQHVHCKVIICEEAGEVLEAHMLSVLLPTVEHFIQIGDHQQLRPTINNHGLSLESKRGQAYQLDRSQFERLSVGGPGRSPFPVAQLNVQRRMRPEISSLIRPLYPLLIDHSSTKSFPDVVGMRQNVFWLDHENMEELPNADRHQKSHSNDWEVSMTHALVRHIVRQGVYSSSDIAVLTPYTGQLQKLRAKMRNDFEIVLSDRDEEVLAKDGFQEELEPPADDQTFSTPSRKPLKRKKLSELLRIATVDNFQGEESKIIIISLVRSNTEKKVGFLKTTNRVNVLLSRAQHGMFLIGNTPTYSNVPMWAQVIGMLEERNCVNKAFGLCCPRHPDIVMQASEPLDFETLSPEGGCQLPCDRRLTECGHKCLARCHSESMHDVFKCPQPCQRLHTPCNHSCQKATCGEDCGVCMIKLDDIKLPCGHMKNAVPCYQTQNLDEIYCDVVVERVVPGCKHKLQISCSQDVTAVQFKCPAPCETNLQCGHRCPGSCGLCNFKDQGGQPVIKHRQCEKICGRRFTTCSHSCKRKCHDGTSCGLCPSPCEVQCSHSRCTLQCREGCAPCVELCTWSCEHQGDCKMPCSAPCNRLPCNERCPKFLSCGHRCPGICGELCAEGYCQECSQRLDSRVDFLEMKSYAEIDIDETSIVVLSCGHFFTAESLDGLMGMSEVYEIDGRGQFTALKDTSSLSRNIPSCPDCNCPVRQFATQRYNRVINKAVIDEMTKRYLTAGKEGLQKLEIETEVFESALKSTADGMAEEIQQGVLSKVAKLALMKVSSFNTLLKKQNGSVKAFESKIKKFCESVADKHQPAQKLHEATITASRKHLELGTQMGKLSLDNTNRDNRVAMGGRMLQLKASSVVLHNNFTLAQLLKPHSASLPINVPNTSTKQFFQTCEAFIKDCENLPKMAVETTILYAGVARCLQSSAGSTHDALAPVETAKNLLADALRLCKERFQNAETLKTAVEGSIRMLRSQWYEEVTKEEIELIKTAMVSGASGIATHSGHWYNCARGHPFAIGECGMPMELARCPECGASVGGQNHEAVAGVTRAMGME